ncbi:6,7-dimethyl-8-ribityllumazine synthase [Magnetospirillum sp. UT-4]|uniref:6,7-dimethyl-8-ribityllumazine synthase n=1 Tax=Magnetospirillum sp. UT-4 TaxID=2681467 RepID=UPI001385995B|nr:6,7-dimethyl-8-ribityllumazine synthase [Magnetospirillum sp. UT-4]CAA7617813.1 6,7-dimethyl-8-ribityllumazine synthase [Magnetospirillum sp. UT-4]
MSDTRILVIEARFYDHIADQLLAGATQALDAAGIVWDTLTVPGVLEIPTVLEMVVAAQEQGGIDVRYDGYVVLGTAIRGESDHYDHVCSECMRGCNDLAIAYHLALGNGVLTVHNEEQALKRADPARKNIGGLAARACLRLLDIKRGLKLG